MYECIVICTIPYLLYHVQIDYHSAYKLKCFRRWCRYYMLLVQMWGVGYFLIFVCLFVLHIEHEPAYFQQDYLILIQLRVI